MVSLKGSVFNYVLFPFLAMIFIILFAVNGYAISCSSSQQECCSGTVLSCCRKLYPEYPGGFVPSYDLSACISPLCMEMEVAMSNCGKCLIGSTCFQKSDCSYECRGGGLLCKDIEVAVSNCGTCKIGNTCFRKSDCSYECRSGSLELLNCSTAGEEQYRPDPIYECGTQSRICCKSGSFLPVWSDWGATCGVSDICVEKNPCSSNADCCGGKVCSSASGSGLAARFCQYVATEPEEFCSLSNKPACTLPYGTCTSISCECSNGSWINCKKEGYCLGGYIEVYDPNYGVCCEKTDGSGPLCRRTSVI